MKNNFREKCIIKINKLPKTAVIIIGFLTIMLAGAVEVLLNSVSKYLGPIAFVIIALIGFWILISPGEYKKIMAAESAAKKTASKSSTNNADNINNVKKITKRTNKQYKKKKKRR